MADSMNIAKLMQVPEEGHDINWLIDALHAAIKLELATIPPYLFAFWSIKDDAGFVAQSIRQIAMQEMLHMALMCNLLSAVGGSPKVNLPAEVPVYPGPLPSGIHAGLVIRLEGFSRDLAKVFMEIELPEHGPIALVATKTFSTIGAFYSAVEAAFEKLHPPLSEARQFDGFLGGLQKIRDLAGVHAAIELIKHQGEGSTTSPDEMGAAAGRLAHYYRFGEMYNGKRLALDAASGKWRYAGAAVAIPDVWPVDPVPPGGYRQQDVPPAAWSLIAACDTAYTTMLNQIATAWQEGREDMLGAAVQSMFDLAFSGVELMKISKPSGSGNYGPCFRLRPGA